MNTANDTLTLVIRLACELEHTHAPETLEVLARWKPALDAMLAGKTREEAIALVSHRDAPRHTGHEPDCADCPTPAECKAANRCAMMEKQ